MNQSMLTQIRKAHQTQININPEFIIIYRPVMVDDHSGGVCEDPSGAKTPVNIKCRISHEKSGPDMDENKSAGLSTNLSRFIITDYLNIIYKGDQFTDSYGRSWKIGPVDTLDKFGGVTGYQAPLIEANPVLEASQI